MTALRLHDKEEVDHQLLHGLDRVPAGGCCAYSDDLRHDDWVRTGTIRQHVGMRPISILGDDTLLTHLADQARLLADAFTLSDPAALVPGLEWDVRTVITHTGAVHRWAADIVARALPTDETGGSIAFWPPESDDQQLAAWFGDGAAALVATLRGAPASLACFTFIPDVAPRTFWIRRQAHETAIHRADVQAAMGGPVTSVDASFAQDGLAEIVGAFAIEPGFATSRRDGCCSTRRMARRGTSRSATPATSSCPAIWPATTPMPSSAAPVTSSTAGHGTGRQTWPQQVTRRSSPAGAPYA